MKANLITSTESKRLTELEKTIERGKKSFIEVGLALAEIKSAKLYRAEHGTFEDYCNAKWGWTRQHAYRLIKCAPVAECNTRVTSVRQAEQLAKVPEENREQVLDAAIDKAESEDRPLKAADIAEAAEEDVDSDEPAPRKLSPAAQSLAENFYAVQVEEAIEGIITECLSEGSAVQWKSVQKVLMSFWSMRKTDK